MVGLSVVACTEMVVAGSKLKTLQIDVESYATFFSMLNQCYIMTTVTYSIR